MRPSLPNLRRQREEVLQKIQAIDRLRRGTLSEQFFTTKRDGKSIRQGPYDVLQCYLKGCKCSERVPAEHAEQVKSDVANYRLFQQLAEQFVKLTDQITRLESGQPGAKKTPRLGGQPRTMRRIKSILKVGPSAMGAGGPWQSGSPRAGIAGSVAQRRTPVAAEFVGRMLCGSAREHQPPWRKTSPGSFQANSNAFGSRSNPTRLLLQPVHRPRTSAIGPSSGIGGWFFSWFSSVSQPGCGPFWL